MAISVSQEGEAKILTSRNLAQFFKLVCYYRLNLGCVEVRLGFDNRVPRYIFAVDVGLEMSICILNIVYYREIY